MGQDDSQALADFREALATATAMAMAMGDPDTMTMLAREAVLGDARSNHTDLALPVVKDLVYAVRLSWWHNPEHTRNWNTGDSAAREYGQLLSMVECRNLTQLGEFVHDLA